MDPPKVGVIDIGSNTIKLLVAEGLRDGGFQQVQFEIEEIRIGEGMTSSPPKILEPAFSRAVAAVTSLASKSRRHRLAAFRIVATSAVRDAENGAEFAKAVEIAAGSAVEILDGNDEAKLVAKGARQDPELRNIDNLALLDLGGGSLECIQFSAGALHQHHSFDLGAVRLTSRFVRDRSAPLNAATSKAIERHVRDVLENSPVNPHELINEAALSGGSAAIFASALSEHSSLATLDLENALMLRDRICNASFVERIERLGIPEKRADIFPAAAIVICSSMDYLGCRAARITHFNMRAGVVAEMLEEAS